MALTSNKPSKSAQSSSHERENVLALASGFYGEGNLELKGQEVVAGDIALKSLPFDFHNDRDPSREIS